MQLTPWNTQVIGVGASLAGPVLAGPLFRRFNKIHYIHIKKWHARLRAPITTRPLQSPSYTLASYAKETGSLALT